MPKKKDTEDKVYAFILNYFKTRYEENLPNRITRPKDDYKTFPTMESIVNLVLADKKYHESNSDEEIKPGQTSVSRGTIRKAINRLCDENKIAMTRGSYEYVPHMDTALEQHPILDIAPQIDISIGVPNEIVILSVAPEFTTCIANYLSALFYKGDILFIPISGKILCISVFPQSVLEGSTNSHISESVSLRERIHVALHRFKLHYPQFPYGQNYEYAYHVSHNPEIVEQITKDAKRIGDKLPYRSNTSIFKSIQESAFFLAEHPFVEGQDHSLDTDSDGEEIVGFPSQDEWDTMDSITHSIVDEETAPYG